MPCLDYYKGTRTGWGTPPSVRTGKLVVTASDDKTARLWDVPVGRRRGLCSGHEGPGVPAAFSPDGKQVVTAQRDKTARLWDVARAGSSQLQGIRGGDTAAFSPDGKLVVTASA